MAERNMSDHIIEALTRGALYGSDIATQAGRERLQELYGMLWPSRRCWQQRALSAEAKLAAVRELADDAAIGEVLTADLCAILDEAEETACG